MTRKWGIPGLSFSWRRAIGASAAKGKLSRMIGVPLTRSGRQRAVGRALGCAVPLAMGALGLVAALSIGWAASAFA